MDCKDLMVGDLVRFKENYPQKELQGKIAKIKGVRGRIDVRTQDGEYHESEHPDWLEPIPLTEDILVKNGFKKFAEGQANFDYTDNDIHLEYWIGDGCFRYYTAEIRYVHQLQHLLRLCGIEKEIEL